jgi:hypothetical protein
VKRKPLRSQAKKNLARIAPVIVALIMVSCVCVGSTTPDVVATGVVLTLTSSHSTRQAEAASQGGDQSPTPTPTTTITPTPTLTTTTTATPTITSTTQGSQGQPAKPSTPTRTSTKQTGASSSVEIVSFTTDKAQVTRPDKAILKWETKNANTVTLKYDAGGPANVDKTSNGFAVDSTTLGLGKHTITLAATGGGKTVTKTVTFEILATPPATSVEIVFFTVDKAAITQAESTHLKWETKNADTVTLTYDADAPVAVDKTSNGLEIFGVVMTTGKHTFTLTATGGGKSVTKSLTVEGVGPTTSPDITSFTSDKSCLNGGEIATLNWTVTGADNLRLEGYNATDPVPFDTWNVTTSPWTIGDHNLLSGGENILKLIATNAVGPVSVQLSIFVPCP